MSRLNRVFRSEASGRLSIGLLFLIGLQAASGQGIDLENRPISNVTIEGLKQVPETLVINQLRLKPGDPYQLDVAEQDVVRINALGRFETVTTAAKPLPDGSVEVIYRVIEQPAISDVLFVGNKHISDQDLAKLVLLRSGDSVNAFLIERGIKEIKKAYEKRGYYLADATIDQERLKEEGVLLFQIREGWRPKIRGIRFQGNSSFTNKQLKSRVKAKKYFPLLQKGQVSTEQLTMDVAELRSFYQGRGYLDVEVDRDITMSQNRKDATITFLIQEGRQYTVASIGIEGNRVFPAEQILARMALKVGDVYSKARTDSTITGLQDMYGKLGYIEARIDVAPPIFHEKEPKVDVHVSIRELIPYTVGKLTVKGNQLTKDKVIHRQVRGMKPGHTFDRTGVETTRKRLAPSSLFDQARVTILGDVQDPVRDVLVEVKEKNTGSLGFGAGISSDAGVAGAIDLVQRNFDLFDFPESFGEFVTGKSFRGAGQFFAIRVQPGVDRSLYSINFREPYILDSDYFLETNLFFFDRDRDDWDEQRIGGRVALGQRFGDVYSAAIRTRWEKVDITDIDSTAPIDVFAVEGDNLVTSLGLSFSRNTTDSRIFPTRGSRLTTSIERVGALSGDFDFWKTSANFRKFWTVDENFFGRRSVLSLRTEVGYIFDDGTETETVTTDSGPPAETAPVTISGAPLYERFYAGGHRSFRGFEFRGVGPRGINMNNSLSNDAVGGVFLFLLGMEYNYPIYQEIVRGVFFVDSGTLRRDDIGLDEYRLSVGAGIRLQVPFIGSAPFAFDLAIPVLKEDDDETQIFSFDIAIPF